MICMAETANNEDQFDVAVSFAGEDRSYVLQVVDQLRGKMKIFYDEDYKTEAWGRDGVEYFTDVFMNQSWYVIMFISQHYAEKMWTNVERRAALSKAVSLHSPYILPVRLDDTELEGLLPTTIYLDARVEGLDKLVKAIQKKVATTPNVAPAKPVLDGRVPTTREGVNALIEERPDFWEYLLYAALLKQNLDKLEGQYQDFTIGYSERNQQHVGRENLIEFVRTNLESIATIVRNFEVVLNPKVQERAFGKPGTPGDVDRIVHLATRFVSVYRDFIDWAANIRGATVGFGPVAETLQLLSLAAEQPISECRRFVNTFVTEVNSAQERAHAGEKVNIAMKVKLELDSDLMDLMHEKIIIATTGTQR
jgi:hypothetical protein